MCGVEGVRDWLLLSLYHYCSCSLWHLQRETERKETKDGSSSSSSSTSSSSSEMFFMWKLHQDLTTKRAPCHLQLHGGAHPQSQRGAPHKRQTEKTQPTKSSPRVRSRWQTLKRPGFSHTSLASDQGVLLTSSAASFPPRWHAGACE